MVSKFCCTFAPSTLETAVALKGDPSPGTTVSSAFFDSVLFGQDVGESARGAARWAVTPYFLFPPEETKFTLVKTKFRLA